MDYIDLKVVDDDLALDPGGEPELLGDRDSIVQDIKHLIRDSGELVAIVGQRNAIKVQGHLQKLEMMIDEDVRLVPGTIRIEQQAVGLFFVTATTVKFGLLSLEVVA